MRRCLIGETTVLKSDFQAAVLKNDLLRMVLDLDIVFGEPVFLMSTVAIA
jgi:hypothetical protein